MKTLEQFENHPNSEITLSDFLSVGDEIDEQMYHHIGCGYMAPHYDENGIMQGGDPCSETEYGVYTYDTVSKVNGKYYYLGELPEFKTHRDDD